MKMREYKPTFTNANTGDLINADINGARELRLLATCRDTIKNVDI